MTARERCIGCRKRWGKVQGTAILGFGRSEPVTLHVIPDRARLWPDTPTHPPFTACMAVKR